MRWCFRVAGTLRELAIFAAGVANPAWTVGLPPAAFRIIFRIQGAATTGQPENEQCGQEDLGEERGKGKF